MTHYYVHAWHPALAYQIMLALSCPWVEGEGGACVYLHVSVEGEKQNVHMCRRHASVTLLSLAKPLANCRVVTKWQNHNGIKSSSGNNVCAGADSFHLFSLKWKWDGSSIFLPKWHACTRGSRNVKHSMFNIHLDDYACTGMYRVYSNKCTMAEITTPHIGSCSLN